MSAALFTSAAEPVLTWQSKSPQELAKKLNTVLAQFPPENQSASIMVMMGLAQFGYPAFPGVDAQASIAGEILEDGTSVVALKASGDSALAKNLSQSGDPRRVGEWLVFPGGVDEDKAKAVIASAGKPFDGDFSISFSASSVFSEEAPAELKKYAAAVDSEISELAISGEIGAENVSFTFSALSKEGGEVRKMISSIRRAERVDESKFLPKNAPLYIVSGCVLSREFGESAANLIRKFISDEALKKLGIEKLEELIAPYPGEGTMACVMTGEKDVAAVVKTKATQAQMFAYEKTLLSLANAAFSDTGLEQNLALMEPSLNFSDALDSLRESEEGGMKIIEYSADGKLTVLTVENGFAVSVSSPDRERALSMLKTLRERVGSGKAAQDPLPDSTGSADIIMRIKIPEIFFEDSMPLAIKPFEMGIDANFKGEKAEARLYIPTKSLIDLFMAGSSAGGLLGQPLYQEPAGVQ